MLKNDVSFILSFMILTAKMWIFGFSPGCARRNRVIWCSLLGAQCLMEDEHSCEALDQAVLAHFCIAPCFFSVMKIFERQQEELGVFIWWISMKNIFGVYSQCRSKTFLGGSKWNGMLLRLPPVQESCIFRWCVRDLDFKSMINLS